MVLTPTFACYGCRASSLRPGDTSSVRSGECPRPTVFGRIVSPHLAGSVIFLGLGLDCGGSGGGCTWQCSVGLPRQRLHAMFIRSLDGDRGTAAGVLRAMLGQQGEWFGSGWCGIESSSCVEGAAGQLARGPLMLRIRSAHAPRGDCSCSACGKSREVLPDSHLPLAFAWRLVRGLSAHSAPACSMLLLCELVGPAYL